MTDIYKMGNIFEWNKKEVVFIEWSGENKALVYNGKQRDLPATLLFQDFTKEAVLKGLTFENFLDMAREEGEEVSCSFKQNGEILLNVTKELRKLTIEGRTFEKKKKEPLSAFLLRVAKERKYL